jgi:hypothetical protein
MRRLYAYQPFAVTRRIVVVCRRAKLETVLSRPNSWCSIHLSTIAHECFPRYAFTNGTNIAGTRFRTVLAAAKTQIQHDCAHRYSGACRYPGNWRTTWMGDWNRDPNYPGVQVRSSIGAHYVQVKNVSNETLRVGAMRRNARFTLILNQDRLAMSIGGARRLDGLEIGKENNSGAAVCREPGWWQIAPSRHRHR